MCTIERNGDSELEQKLLTPTNRNNDIKTDVIVLFVVVFGRICKNFEQKQAVLTRSRV